MREGGKAPAFFTSLPRGSVTNTEYEEAFSLLRFLLVKKFVIKFAEREVQPWH